MQNAEAKILAATYRDRMTVTRSSRIKDEGTHEMEARDVTVYDGVPCALSPSGSSAPSKDSGNNRYTASDTYTIFAAPGIFCRAGDMVTVTTEAGQVYTGRTGRSMGYASHTETPLGVERLI